jgi:hypothetical protein
MKGYAGATQSIKRPSCLIIFLLRVDIPVWPFISLTRQDGSSEEYVKQIEIRTTEEILKVIRASQQEYQRYEQCR